jgi:antitoxin CptB
MPLGDTIPAVGDAALAASHDVARGADALLEAGEFSRLRWRCRRGMLENDLFIERYLRVVDGAMTRRQAAGLQALMDLADNDLLDLLLARCEPDGNLDRDEVHDVLASMRSLRAAPGP